MRVFDKSAEIGESARLYMGIMGCRHDFRRSQRSQFLGIAIARCRARIRAGRGVQIDFGQAAPTDDQSGAAHTVLRHRAGPAQAKDVIGRNDAVPANTVDE